MKLLGLLFISLAISGMASVVLVAPYKPASLKDYFYVVFRHIGVASLVIVFGVFFAVGLMLVFGG